MAENANRVDTEATVPSWWIYVCPSSGSPYSCGCDLDERWEGEDLIREDCQEREIRVVERAEYDRIAAEREQLREAIASALTSLATGPMKDGYAYAVLGEALNGTSPNEGGES